jgi:predicted negative regulator of RcsB-dependent stress response
MPLDLEEQEKLAELKAWWGVNGGFIVGALLVAAIAFAGWSGWKRYEAGQAREASVLYETLARASQAGDARVVREAGGSLIEKYPRTLYAPMGALVSARFFFEHDDAKNAKAQLRWVIEEGRSDDFRDLARLRLGAVLLDEKAYDEALKLADAKHAGAYDAQYAALKGDILVAKNQAAEARAAYKLALDKAPANERAFRQCVQIRLEALGG